MGKVAALGKALWMRSMVDASPGLQLAYSAEERECVARGVPPSPVLASAAYPTKVVSPSFALAAVAKATREVSPAVGLPCVPVPRLVVVFLRVRIS